MHVYYRLLFGLGCPTVLRCDYGTENTSLATTQIAFRMHHSDALAKERSFVYGPSKSNIVSFIQCSISDFDWTLYRELKPSGHS